MGIGRGAGTTHLSVMIANYLSNGHHKKVMLAAFGSENEYAGYIFDRIKKKAAFDYTFCNSEKDIIKIMAGNYDDIIIDTSTSSMIGRREFQRSQKKIIIGSMSRWKVHELHNYLEKSEKEYENMNFCFLSLTNERKEAIAIKKRYGVDIGMIPFEKDPFHMDGKHMKWIKELIM